MASRDKSYKSRLEYTAEQRTAVLWYSHTLEYRKIHCACKKIHFIKLSISEAYIAFAFYLQQAQFLKWNQVLLIKLVPGMAQ